jgi:hypothetical protein
MRDLRCEVIGQIAEGGIGNPGDAAGRPELLARARELGKRLAAG